MRVVSMVVGCSWALAACSNDFHISGDGVAAAYENPPSLATPVREDIVTQTTTPEVDILWIIDDSGSMSEEQTKLKNNFPEFIKFFLDSGLDWHIGVVSTDTVSPKAGKLRGAAGYTYLDDATPNPVALFQDMASLGIDGSFDERGRRAAHMALTEPLLTGANDGFYRERASLHMIVISDEDDVSANDPSINEFVSWAQGLKYDAENVTFSSIVGQPGGCFASYPGLDYITLSERIGGIVDDICKSDWSEVLEQLGMQAAGLRREYFLSGVPVLESLVVWVDDDGDRYEGIDADTLDEGETAGDVCTTTRCFTYSYDQYRNSVVLLDYVPSPLAKVHIEYELLEGWQPGGESDL